MPSPVPSFALAIVLLGLPAWAEGGGPSGDTPASWARLNARAAAELATVPAPALRPSALLRAYVAAKAELRERKLINYVRYFRIVNSTVYVLRERGRTAGRIHAWLHGLHHVLRAAGVGGGLPDVDFILDANDIAACHLQRNALLARAPIFSFSKRPGTGCVLVPCFSTMHDQYFAPDSAYSYASLRRFASANPIGARQKAIYFDLGTNGAPPTSNKGLRATFRRWLASHPPMQADEELAVHDALAHKIRGALAGCNHQLFACAEGQAWTMRYKNILLAGAAVLWFRTPQQALLPFEEYWHRDVVPGKHIVLVTAAPQLRALPTNLSEIGAAGEQLAAELLHPTAIVRYLTSVLRQYAALQAQGVPTVRQLGLRGFYKVKLPPLVGYPLAAS